MSSDLRFIGVSVVEEVPGEFRWVILKGLGTVPLIVERDLSPCAFTSWAAALDAGVVALKWLADDDQAGPRWFEDCEG
ncbi:hypothetical protein ACSFA8_23145 [Variovorax sp. RT4R15]|uniref:hypothetical protein n=1 Tax=Variovorax sp. RT4R15 TaxID=3443737 RepID=UPI003F4770E9